MSTSVKFVRGDGKTFTADGTDWNIVSVDGIDGSSITLTKEMNAQTDGLTVTSQTATAKDFKLVVEAVNTYINPIMRKLFLSFFVKGNTYKIYVTYDGATAWSEGVLDLKDCPSGNVYHRVQATVRFTREDAFWKGNDELGTDIAATTGLWGWPLVFTEDGAPSEARNYAQEVFISNDGDFETFCRVVIVASGSVENPQISIGDNYVRLIDTLDIGDTYELDFVNLRVYKNGVIDNTKLDRTSSFTGMGIPIGGTFIEYAADTGENNMKVNVYRYHRLDSVRLL